MLNRQVSLFVVRLLFPLVILICPLSLHAGLFHLKGGRCYFPNQYLCKTCNEVPIKPVQLECPNHKNPVFCRDCIQPSVIKTSIEPKIFANCPLCSVQQPYRANDIEDQILDINVSCEACDERGTYEQHKDCTLITETVDQPSSDYIRRLLAFSETGQGDEILPVLKNPPTWQKVYDDLHHYMAEESRFDTKKEIFAHRLLHEPYISQFPVAETIEGLYRIVKMIYQQHLAQNSGSPLIIASVGSGAGLIERALYERLRKELRSNSYGSGHITSEDNIAVIAPDLFIHCSDIYPGEGCDKRFQMSEPLLPCSSEMDYRDVPEFLLKRHPNARILFFQSWMPCHYDPVKDNWIPHLLAEPAALGYIHIGNPETCGLGSLFPVLANKFYAPGEGFVLAPAGRYGTYFKILEYNLLGWGYEDAMTGVNFYKEQIHLNTKLTFVHSTQLAIDALEMGDLMYDDKFLADRLKHFCKKTQRAPTH